MSDVMRPDDRNDLATPPPAGMVLEQRGHLYRLTGTRPYVNRQGGETWILTWKARCASCGRDFEVTTGLKVSSGLNRRCGIHRRPAVRAKPWNGGAP